SLNLLFALETLDLTNNQLSGEFPALPNLHALKELYMDGNCFTGRIPTVFGRPDHVVYLCATDNCFSTIPDTINQLTWLETLSISGNPFACEIPPEIWNLKDLRVLEMSKCQLSGSLAGVENMRQLECLDMSYNQLSGELPSREIRSLEGLLDLHLIGMNSRG
ncbi:hypothetical protein HDU81_001060, partial [Chytriomyces hyalinus]